MAKEEKHPFVKIEDWMLDLQLSPTELIIYALIYGFTKSTDRGFTGSIDYLRKWVGAGSRSTVTKALKTLSDRELVSKEETQIRGAFKAVSYKTVELSSTESVLVKSEIEYKKCTPSSTETVLNIDRVDNTKNNEKRERQSPERVIEDFTRDVSVREALSDYVEMRKLMNKPLTGKALLFLVSDLEKISTEPKMQVKVIEQATKGSYLGFCEIKKKRTRKANKPIREATSKVWSGVVATDPDGNEVVY